MNSRISIKYTNILGSVLKKFALKTVVFFNIGQNAKFKRTERMKFKFLVICITIHYVINTKFHGVTFTNLLDTSFKH